MGAVVNLELEDYNKLIEFKTQIKSGKIWHHVENWKVKKRN
jgi:hypothetical protein